MFHSKINEYQIENQTLANDMADIKTKYLRQKKLYRWDNLSSDILTNSLFYSGNIESVVLVLNLWCLGTLHVSSGSTGLRPKYMKWNLCPSWSLNLRRGLVEEPSRLIALRDNNGWLHLALKSFESTH